MGPLIDSFTAYTQDLASQLWPGHAPYSFSQLESFWVEAGGSSAAAPIAAAIGMAEQGANQLGDWVGGQPTSLGPWQINAANWPALEAAGIMKSPSDLMNPITNAIAAIFVSGNGANWSPWTTFNTGAYKQYLGGSSGAASGPQSPGIGIPGGSGGAPANFSPAVLAGVATIAVLAGLVALII